MIKIKDINLTIIPGTKIYIDIDIFRFTKDDELFEVEVGLECNGEYEHMETIDLGRDGDEIIVDHRDLERVALNWIFRNVELVQTQIDFN